MLKTAWTDLTLTDMYYAYRKAKADAFFNRYFSSAVNFAEYERNLPSNLKDLLAQLRSESIEEVLNNNLGEVRVVSKRLSSEPRSDNISTDSHGFFSDPSRAFKQLLATNNLKPEFRTFAEFPTVIHILSALWINLIGHKYDACLSPRAMGSRLRRYHQRSPQTQTDRRDYHLTAIGIYEPYFVPYKLWRKRGLQSIRSELESGHAVAALTLDISNYYHKIDPAFLIEPDFIKRIGASFSEIELAFTSALVKFIENWNRLSAKKLSSLGVPDLVEAARGLPIGLSASPLIANVLLIEVDRDIEKNITPLYYGRYVDDIFLVLRDPGHITSSADLMKYIARRADCFVPKLDGANYNIEFAESYQFKNELVLQPTKQKAFFLVGRGGLDLLDNIDSQIINVASERRLMPSPKGLDAMASAKILSAANTPADEADTLRKADGLAVRRLGWAVQLRAAETLARDLRPSDWKIERNNFYKFAHNHILRPDRILDHLDYLPRLLSLAVTLEDWSEAKDLFDGTIDAVNRLKSAAKNGCRLNGVVATGSDEKIWVELIETIGVMSKDAILGAIRWDTKSGTARDLPLAAIRLCLKVGIGHNKAEIQQFALHIREADFAKVPYKDHLRRNAAKQKVHVEGEDELVQCYAYINDLNDFLKYSMEAETTAAPRIHEPAADQNYQSSSMLPYVFPTRPYSTQEISLFLPHKCVFGDALQPTEHWARYTQAVRGAWASREVPRNFSAPIDADATNDSTNTDQICGTVSPLLSVESLNMANLGKIGRKEKVILGISSLLTTEYSWKAGGLGAQDISRERYDRIQDLVNQAISSRPRPSHLLLPELALPERWISTVSNLLQYSGINLIAGLDYQVSGKEVFSSAVLVLNDDRLGYKTAVQIRQVKALPAPGEEESLLKLFGLNWRESPKNRKPVYNHMGFSFGVLVCSELQNIKHRLDFQGNIDCLVVLSWNQDLETFSALVESASLDVHAFIALINNRKYGDSRVRSPAKKHHARDLCRLRGGANEHVVMVELDIDRLRAFQSRSKNWPSDDDAFKPKPEGFVLSKFRRTTPT